VNRDWHAWHEPYDQAGSSLAVRLALVQSYIRQALDAAPPGEIRAVSLCAGQGRDLLGVLESHERSRDVRARLVELDPRNVTATNPTLHHLTSRGAIIAGAVDVVEGDAAETDWYTDLIPAHLVLCCGVFGNISDGDVRQVVQALPSFCDTGAVVLWTRHRRPPDLTVAVREWFGEVGFEEISFDGPTHLPYVGLGAVRWPGAPGRLEPGGRLFEWIGDPRPAT
jgi:hypothetical protein